ncbi:MAG: EAL domain-containing protein [Rhodospirillales bacterium]|jgi:diguanylate cyclase|nr:EAL domain-containing protein [Rhodospirillales bacterium]
MDSDQSSEDPKITIERLRSRVLELEYLHERVEGNASAMIGMAEELAIAKDEAEAALRQHKEDQKTIERLALYDPLTGLANRNQFARRFEYAIRQSKRNRLRFALLMLDLDGFKAVNDTFGHLIGDELLKFVSDQFSAATRDTDTVARLGGDEFALILTRLDKDDRASKVADRIIDKLSKPVELDGSLVKTGTSIGISVYPRDGEDKDELLSKADKALYSAKARGKGVYQFFNDEIDKQARAAHILENDLRLAIVRNEFLMHYQPQLVTSTGQVICVEALARWQHPTRGLLLPEEFIEAAESTGLINHLGKVVLNLSCQQCKSWIDDGLDLPRVAVNVSPIQIQDENFVNIVESALADSGLDPRCLELEITESIMMKDVENAAKTLSRLHLLGVSMCIDDFGIGYSSLPYLKALSIQRLKIDPSFIMSLTNDPNDVSVAAAIIKMGRSLELEIIAEGIETEFQEGAVRRMGCDILQGFLICPPLPSSELSEWVTKRNSKDR